MTNTTETGTDTTTPGLGDEEARWLAIFERVESTGIEIPPSVCRLLAGSLRTLAVARQDRAARYQAVDIAVRLVEYWERQAKMLRAERDEAQRLLCEARHRIEALEAT